VPSEHQTKPGEAEALDLLAHIVGAGQNSRLYRKLVEERKLAINAGANYSGTTVDATRFSVYATPQAGTSLPDLEGAVDGVLAEVIENGVTEQELTRAKTRLIADTVYAQDNQATMARWYGGALTTGLSIEDIRTWPDRIRAVTAEQVRAAAQKWLDRKRSVTGYLIKDTTPKREEKRS